MKRIFLCVIAFAMAVMSCLAQEGSETEELGAELFYDKNYTEALPLLREAANGGSLRATCMLSEMYYRGDGVKKDRLKSNTLLSKAIKQNYPMAFYLKSKILIDKDDFEGAFINMKKSADMGYVKAFYMAGIMLSNEVGTTSDPALEFHYFNLANEQEVEFAKAEVAFAYAVGYGVAKDKVKALGLYKEAIGTDYAMLIEDYELYHAKAYFDLLIYLEKDKGKIEAFKIYQAVEEAKPGTIKEEDYNELKNEVDRIIAEEERKTYSADEVDVSAQFPDGDSGILNFLNTHIYYPTPAIEEDLQGTVVVQVVVSKDGSVRDPKIINSVAPVLDKEALRVIKSLPRFTPAMKDGRSVNVYFSFPVTFRLN
ncbi:MAG: TonB family protein [Muribaculaceae bacterium]|nr:TonB family protein [Muribaculaceae bacterium]